VFKVTARNRSWDVVVGYFLMYSVPPNGFVLLGLVLWTFWRIGGKGFLEQKEYFKTAVLALDVFLLEVFLFFLIVLLLVFIYKISGRLRVANLEHEFEFSDDGYTGRTPESEYKNLLKNVSRFAESRRRVIWYTKSNAAEVYLKTNFSPQDLQNLREFFKPKKSKYLEWVCRYGFMVFLALVVVLGGLLFYPRYTVVRTVQQFSAFSEGEETVILIPVSAFGQVVRLVEEIHPYLNIFMGRPMAYTATEYNFFVLKDGVVKPLPGTRLYKAEAFLTAVGDDLYLSSRSRTTSECRKFDGNDFQLVDCKQLEDLQRTCEDTGNHKPKWKAFTLWDEGAQEEDDPRAAQQYFATFNAASHSIQVEWDQPAQNYENPVMESKYSWKTSSGEKGILIDCSTAPQYVSSAQFKELFPKESVMTGGEE
jgi:uncharacterized membrane protein